MYSIGYNLFSLFLWFFLSSTHIHIYKISFCSNLFVHMLQIKFFHQLDSMNNPVTESEKLIWSVLEAERSTIRFLMPQFFTYVFFSLIFGLWFNFYFICLFLSCSQLHEKSLFDANNAFHDNHKGCPSEHYHLRGITYISSFFMKNLYWFSVCRFFDA